MVTLGFHISFPEGPSKHNQVSPAARVWFLQVVARHSSYPWNFLPYHRLVLQHLSAMPVSANQEQGLDTALAEEESVQKGQTHYRQPCTCHSHRASPPRQWCRTLENKEACAWALLYSSLLLSRNKKIYIKRCLASKAASYHGSYKIKGQETQCTRNVGTYWDWSSLAYMSAPGLLLKNLLHSLSTCSLDFLPQRTLS